MLVVDTVFWLVQASCPFPLVPVLSRRHARSHKGLLRGADRLVGDIQVFGVQVLYRPWSVAVEFQVRRLQLLYRPLSVAAGSACDLCVFSHQQSSRFSRNV